MIGFIVAGLIIGLLALAESSGIGAGGRRGRLER